MPEIAERKDEVLALGRLGVEELGKAVLGVAGVQRAVADRVFGLVGPIALVTRHAYGFVSDGVESGLRGGAGLAARGVEGGLRRLPAGDGDWLVLAPSASGRSRRRRIPFDLEHGMHVGGTNHLALLNHPQVYGRLRDWLGSGSLSL